MTAGGARAGCLVLSSAGILYRGGKVFEGQLPREPRRAWLLILQGSSRQRWYWWDMLAAEPVGVAGKRIGVAFVGRGAMKFL